MTTNSGKIQCELCGSVILLPNTAKWVEISQGIFLPPMKTTDKEGVNAHEFWTVTDMFAFENVGFCNTVDGIKYLACADCDVGPIGAHLMNDENMFYISPLRVKHINSDALESQDISKSKNNDNIHINKNTSD